MLTKKIEVREHVTLRVIAATAISLEGCWLYEKNMVGHDGYKYPTVRFKEGGKKFSYRAGRYMYTAVVGPIPDGLTIDHTCNNVICVNPAHLEPVTQAENNRRKSERKTHCKNGHAFIPENRNTQNACRLCLRDYHKAYKATRKGNK